MEREAEPGSLTHTVAAAPVLGRLVVLCLQGDELETGRNPCEAGVRAENQYQAQEGSAKHLNTPLVAQRFTTGEAGQVGQGGGIRGNGSWFPPGWQPEGWAGQLLCLVSEPLGLENVLSGPADAALDGGMMAQGAVGVGEKGNHLEPTRCRERSLGPRPPEPQIQTFCEYFITDQTLLDKQRSPISPSVGVLWSPFPLLSLGGLGTH